MKATYIVLLFSTVSSLLFSASIVQSYVQIETGKVVQEITDLELSDGKSLFEINRIYIHGGKNKSLLGSSWCFDFEEELRAENDGYRIFTCGKSTATYFKPEKRNFVFENEKMTRSKDGTFKRTTSGEIIKYNEVGRMTSRAPKGKNSTLTKFYYDDSNNITKINYLGHYEIEFNYDNNKKLASISTKGRRVAAYSVIEENLVSVKNSFGEDYNYDYDDLGYVTTVKDSDEGKQEFSYNKKSRLVSTHKSSEGCSRDFEYTLKNNNRLDLKMLDSCAKDRPLQISFSDKITIKKEKKKSKSKKKRNTADMESEYVVKRDGQFRINKIEDQIKTWIIEYKSENNKILAITEITKKTNKAKVYKAKYKNGQITELSGKGKGKRTDKLQFVYSKDGGLIKITADIKNKKSKQSTIAKFELIHAVVGAN